MVDISIVPPDAKLILLMVGVALDRSLLLLYSYVTCGGRGHGRVLSLFTKDAYPFLYFLSLFVLTMNSNSTILCLK